MKVLKMSLLSTMTLLICACGGTPACQKPQPYEESRLGKQIEAPEGLDPLQSSGEMAIPEPSPRPPRPADAPCLESPPSFQTGERTDGDE